MLLITFGSAHDVAGNASKLKLPEAQSRLGLAHALEELVALPRELAFPEKALELRNVRMNFQSTFDQLPVADRRVRAYSTFEYFELSSSHLC